MTYEIEITDRQSLMPLPAGEIRRCAEILLGAEEVSSASLSLVFVTDREILQINRDYLQHNYPTDVISFLLEECPPGTDGAIPDFPRGYGKQLEGEVVVSVETAIRSAPEYNWSAEQETILYVLHGLLHLAGYDDLSDDERTIMRRREREVLLLCGMEPPETAMDDPSEEPRVHSPSPDREVNDS